MTSPTFCFQRFLILFLIQKLHFFCVWINPLCVWCLLCFIWFLLFFFCCLFCSAFLRQSILVPKTLFSTLCFELISVWICFSLCLPSVTLSVTSLFLSNLALLHFKLSEVLFLSNSISLKILYKSLCFKKCFSFYWCVFFFEVTVKRILTKSFPTCFVTLRY